MKTLAEIKNTLTKQVKQNEKEIKETEKILEETETTLEALNAALLKSEEEVNYDEYSRIKGEIWTAKGKKELAEKRLKQLTTVPLITKATFFDLVDEIGQTTRATEKELTEQALEIAKGIQTLSDKSRENASEQRELLDFIEEKVIKHSEDYKKNEVGGIIRVGQRVSDYYSDAPALPLVYEGFVSHPIFKNLGTNKR